VVSGLAFLKSVQQEDGGFAYDVAGGYGSDANSTSYALQALAAAGEDPAADAWRAEGEDSPSPVDYLLSLQLEDGALEWQADGGANAAATQQAVAALLRRPLPIAVQPVDRCRSR
jgi:prenyltransferase beta subunit